MTRAKEYADRYIADPSMSELSEIAKEFIKEFTELAATRGTKSPGALYSVINELNKKWIAFADRVNKELKVSAIKPDGFEQLIRIKLPDLYQYWKRSKNLSRGK